MNRLSITALVLALFWPSTARADSGEADKAQYRYMFGLTYLSIPTASLELGGELTIGGGQRNFVLTDPQLTESGRVHGLALFGEITNEVREHTFAGLSLAFGGTYPSNPRPVTTSLSGLIFELSDEVSWYGSIGGVFGARANIKRVTLRAQAQLGIRWLNFKGGPAPLGVGNLEIQKVNDVQVFLRPSVLADIWIWPRAPLTVGLSTDPFREGEFAIFVAFGRSSWTRDSVP